VRTARYSTQPGPLIRPRSRVQPGFTVNTPDTQDLFRRRWSEALTCANAADVSGLQPHTAPGRTLNQRVGGSSPSRRTTSDLGFRPFESDRTWLPPRPWANFGFKRLFRRLFPPPFVRAADHHRLTFRFGVDRGTRCSHRSAGRESQSIWPISTAAVRLRVNVIFSPMTLNR
jgi:hypothetical protein